MLDDISVESVVEDGGSTGRGRITMLRLAWRRDDPLAVVSVLPILKRKSAFGLPWKLSVSVPVRAADDVKQ